MSLPQQRLWLSAGGALLACCLLYSYSTYEPAAPLLGVPLDLKYIYQFADPNWDPFDRMKQGQSVFIASNCTYRNCFITSKPNLLGDVRLFDAVLFHGPELRYLKSLPKRDPRQKYVFVSIESSHNYPVCDPRWEHFFNWTWSYRLDSDVAYPYVSVRDETGQVVAPAQEVAWIHPDRMAPLPGSLQDSLRTKRLAAAWFVSNCNALSKRQNFAKKLRKELAAFGLRLDTWGRCGRACPDEQAGGRAGDAEGGCLRLVKRRYYFYLALENSFSDDYVTEKLLHATRHLAVPVVYGGANYTRFLPPGSFLDGRRLGAAGTARRMRDLIANPSLYQQYHRWRSHYSYHNPSDSPDTNPHCRLCEMLHSDQYRISTVYDNFRAWWNGSAPVSC